MTIKEVTFLGETFKVNETNTSYEMTNALTNDTVTVHKSKCELKEGFIFNKGLKFKITKQD